LKEAHDRLNRNPSNSSRPPSTRVPWEKGDKPSQDDTADDDVPRDVASDAAVDQTHEDEAETGPRDKEKSDLKQTDPRERSQGRPERRQGAEQHSRTQQLPIDVQCEQKMHPS